MRKLFIALIFILCTDLCWAQDTWPSPEVELMYTHANEYMALGNYRAAVTTYKQLQTFVPDNKHVSWLLAQAYYKNGDARSCIPELKQVLAAKPRINDTAYQLLAAAQAEAGLSKEARATADKGIDLFHTALLYFEKGKILLEEGNELEAVSAWMEGIQRDNNCPLNYHEAALSFWGSNDIWPGLVLGEEYLAMKHDTAGDDAFKKGLYDAWQRFFNTLTEHKKENGAYKAFTSLTPVVSDGVTTENLTMARTRYLMQCANGNKTMYSFEPSLIAYQDSLVVGGWFDIYNEWLFGKAESQVEYNAWNKFHDGDMAKFLYWQQTHYLAPRSGDPYSIPDLSRTFSKKRKR